MRRFPVREPMRTDLDLQSGCCTPKPSYAGFIWDGADNFFFRPFSETAGVVVSGEAINVNALDEVPDSAWFRNRPLAPIDRIGRGACTTEQILDPANTPDGAWLIDKGKMGGTVPGFRIKVPGKGKYLLKVDPVGEHERSSAASVIGAAILHAAGYYTACEQIVWVKPSIFTLTPGLHTKMNLGAEKPFDRAALDETIALAPKRNGLVRFEASAWVEGYTIGPFFYEGTRADDRNDVVPHEDRRDLRGLRVLAAWLGRYDARAGNTLDVWRADDRKRPESSPGHVLHYQLDTSECFGAGYNIPELDRRLNYAYIIDWGDFASDFLTLGIRQRPWDVIRRDPVFGSFDVEHFVPDEWKPQYPNAAFGRMTERDAAWMARILARFTPEAIHAIVAQADLPDAGRLESILASRLEATLKRYLSRVSPITDVRLDGNRLCAVDLAERRLHVPVRYSARAEDVPLAVERRGDGVICTTLPATDAYVRVFVEDGFARGPLVVHVAKATITGIERP